MGSLHHLQVGCADATVLRTDACFLVDSHRIEEFEYLLPADRRIRGLFVTHQHRDHYSGMEFLRRRGYGIDCLITSPYERRYEDASVTVDEWQEFADHRNHFERQGTKIYCPYRQTSWEKPYWETNGLRFWVLGPHPNRARSDTRVLHDACLVVNVQMGNRSCLFTGDASDLNLQDVAAMDHICDDILHASHHGSLEGANLDFIKKCKAGYTVISTEAGVHENVPHPIAVRRYQENTRTRVYRTDQDGTLKWSF